MKYLREGMYTLEKYSIKQQHVEKYITITIMIIKIAIMILTILTTISYIYTTNRLEKYLLLVSALD